MKNKLLLTATATLALANLSNAATISVVNLRPGDTGNGGFSVSNTTSSAPGIVRTISFTQTGDLDGGLGGNDTLSFDLVETYYTGSTFSAGDVTLGGQANVAGNGNNFGNNNIGNLSTLTFEITNVVYTSAESTVDFSGFTEIRKVNSAPAPTNGEDITFYVGETGATTVLLTVNNSNQDFDLTSNSDNTLLTLTTDYSSLASGGLIRLRELDFAFETSLIPEPSSTALLGLGGLALLLRRRRA